MIVENAFSTASGSLDTIRIFSFLAAGFPHPFCQTVNCAGIYGKASYSPVSAEVEAYTPLIQKYVKQCGIPEYVELIKAVMMQESGGKGSDPM